jgi:hypothetical protein
MRLLAASRSVADRQEIERYDAADARRVSDAVRARARPF